MAMRLVVLAGATLVALALLYNTAAWRYSHAAARGLLSEALPQAARRLEVASPGKQAAAGAGGPRGAPAAHFDEASGEWRQIGDGQNEFGLGSGDCTGCSTPIQTHALLNPTLEECQHWLMRGCPGDPDLPHGCPGANALAYHVGMSPSAPRMCRAWTCLGSVPGHNSDASWNCMLLDGNPSGTTGAPTVPTSIVSTSTRSTNGTTSTLPPPSGPQCTERSPTSYRLDWRSEGQSFFDDWTFLQHDHNNGAVEYVDRATAVSEKVVEVHNTHSILRAGPKSPRQELKRTSAKIQTNRAWTYFLMAMKFHHTPWGCGLWPALWTHAPGFRWPEGGELDILEYVNDLPSQTSFHTGVANRCALHGAEVNRPSCTPMPDLNGMNYDCTTAYPLKLGCAVNKLPLLSPYEWAQNPGVVAVEWTERFLKIFVIPESEIPADLNGDDPKPDSWSRWLVSYYPFASTEENWPGLCPNPDKVMQPQQIIMNINFCGDWASKVWPMSGSCVNRVGPHFPLQCKAIDPLLDRRPNAPAEDCCTQFIWDENGEFGTDAYLAERAFFNISWIKVFQQQPGV